MAESATGTQVEDWSYGAGAAKDFFERVRKSPDKASPQLINVANAVGKAATSEDPNMKAWAREMNVAFDQTAEGRVLANTSAQPFGGIMGTFEKVLDAIKTSLSDGFQMGDLKTIMNAFNSSADHDFKQKFASGEQHLKDANLYQTAAGEAGKEINRAVGNGADVNIALRNIQMGGGMS